MRLLKRGPQKFMKKVRVLRDIQEAKPSVACLTMKL